MARAANSREPAPCERRAHDVRRAVAARVHRHRQGVSATEHADEQGDEHRRPCAQAHHQAGLPEFGAARPLRVVDAAQLLGDRAIERTDATSSTGTRSLRRGRRKLENASVSSVDVVVKLTSRLAITSSTMRIA